MVDERAGIGEAQNNPKRNYADVEEFLYQKQGYYRQQSENGSLDALERAKAKAEYGRVHQVTQKMEEVTDLKTWRTYTPALEAVQSYVNKTFDHIIQEKKGQPKPDLDAIQYHQETRSLLNQSIKNPDFKIPTPREPVSKR